MSLLHLTFKLKSFFIRCKLSEGSISLGFYRLLAATAAYPTVLSFLFCLEWPGTRGSSGPAEVAKSVRSDRGGGGEPCGQKTKCCQSYPDKLKEREACVAFLEKDTNDITRPEVRVHTGWKYGPLTDKGLVCVRVIE